HDRLLPRRHRQQRSSSGRRVQDRPIRAREFALLPGQERHVRSRGPVGPPRQQLRRFRRERFPHSVFRKDELRPFVGRSVMNYKKTMLAAIVIAATSVGASWAQTPAEIDSALKAAYEKYKGLKE